MLAGNADAGASYPDADPDAIYPVIWIQIILILMLIYYQNNVLVL